MLPPEDWQTVVLMASSVFSTLALYWTIRAGSPHDIRTENNANALQLQDLKDRIDQWSKRDAVRASRERRFMENEELAARPAASDTLNPKQRKAHLRAKLRSP